VTRNGSALTITLQGVGITYEGKISKDLASIDGTFTQGSASIPLLLKK
jgi:hypothetical protein